MLMTVFGMDAIFLQITNHLSWLRLLSNDVRMFNSLGCGVYRARVF